MVFGNITTFYIPIAGSAGSSLWGTDVRKLLDTADGTSDSTTKTNHGTGGGTTVRTVDPYTTSTADSDQTLYGWAITPTDMGGSSGARRFFPAGDHTLTVRASHSNLTALTGNLTVYAYRVGTAGASRARTLLGSATAAVSLGALGAKVDAVVTVTLAEVIFEPDETIQYSAEMSLLGTAITGNIATYYTGTDTGTAARIDTPELGVLANTTGTASGSGSATGAAAIVLGTIGSSAGSSTATAVGASRADTVGTATGTSTAAGVGASRADTVGTASGSSTATAITSIVLGTIGTVNVSDAPTDYTPNDEQKTIADIVRHHETGAGITGATVNLIRDSDGYQAATTTSEGGGAYSFTRDTNDPNTYHVYVHYLDGTTKIQGVSERGLTPS